MQKRQKLLVNNNSEPKVRKKNTHTIFTNACLKIKKNIHIRMNANLVAAEKEKQNKV